MRIRTLALAVGVVFVAASAAVAAGWTERLQTERMTVQYFCVEHQRWTSVAKDSLASVQTGDIVRLEPAAGRPRLVVLRTAADELASPE